MSLYDSHAKRIEVALQRTGQTVEVRRRGGGTLVVPKNETFTVEAGETVRFEEVDTSAPGAELIVNGTVITDTEENNENIYGITTDDAAGSVLLGEYSARRMYLGQEDLPDLQIEAGGKRGTDTPVIAFPRDNIMQRGDRVTFPNGERYELQAKLARDTHTQFQTSKITS